MRLVVLFVSVGCGRIGFDATDAPSDAVSDVATACPPGSLLCDDFETGDLSRWSAIVETDPADTIEVTGAQRRSGRLGLEARVAASQGDGAVATACLEVPTTLGMLAVRAWIYAPTQPDRYEGVMALFDSAACTDTYQSYLLVACDGGNWYVSEQGDLGLVDRQGAACMPANTWTCVEVNYTFTPNPRVQLYMNDVVVLDTAGDPTPSFGTILVGVARATMTGYANFTDDVVVATSHIGCD